MENFYEIYGKKDMKIISKQKCVIFLNYKYFFYILFYKSLIIIIFCKYNLRLFCNVYFFNFENRL